MNTTLSSPQDISTPLLPSGSDDHVSLTATDKLGGGPPIPALEASEPHCEVHPNEPHPVDAKISVLALAMIIFYNVTGGPFGIEPTIKAGGNFYAILGIALMPVLWAIPEMYMTYRLSTLYPCASGGVLWCETAFGPSMGLMQGYLGWLGGVVNAATYPALLFEYTISQIYADKGNSEVNYLIRYFSMLLLVLLMTLVNYRGLDVVGKASTSIYIFSMSAFVMMAIIGFPKVDPEKWLQRPQADVSEQFDDDALVTTGWLPLGIEMRVFINTLYWNFNNFDQAGHYSTSVPKKTFKRGMIGSLFLTTSAYLIPVLVATGATDINQDDWKAGTFAVAGNEIGGKWLGNWVVISTAASAIGSFCSELAADSMQLMGMSDRAQIPSVFSYRSSYGTPTYSIILCVIVIASVLPLPFGFIVELTNFAYCMSVTLEFMAFLQLQILHGNRSIPRKISYGFLMTPALCINVIVLLTASNATYIYAALVVIIGLLLINAKSMGSFFRKHCRSCPGESISGGTLDKTVE